MNDRSVVDLLVDTSGVVDDRRLDGLLLDDRLHSLMDMVVLVFVYYKDVSTERCRVMDKIVKGNEATGEETDLSTHHGYRRAPRCAGCHAQSGWAGAWCAAREASAGAREASLKISRRREKGQMTHVLLVLADDGRGSGSRVLGRQRLVVLNRLHTVLVVMNVAAI